MSDTMYRLYVIGMIVDGQNSISRMLKGDVQLEPLCNAITQLEDDGYIFLNFNNEYIVTDKGKEYFSEIAWENGYPCDDCGKRLCICDPGTMELINEAYDEYVASIVDLNLEAEERMVKNWQADSDWAAGILASVYEFHMHITSDEPCPNCGVTTAEYNKAKVLALKGHPVARITHMAQNLIWDIENDVALLWCKHGNEVAADWVGLK